MPEGVAFCSDSGDCSNGGKGIAERLRQYVNSSVSQLAECLLAYMGEEDAEQFRSAMQTIDPPALAEGSFWWHEAEGIGHDV